MWPYRRKLKTRRQLEILEGNSRNCLKNSQGTGNFNFATIRKCWENKVLMEDS